MIRKILLGWLILQAQSLFAQSNTTLFKTAPSFQAILNEARAKNKPVIIDTYFTGCMPCLQMDQEVFPNELVQKEIRENFIGFKVNVFEEEMGDSLNIKYGISGFPTYLILSPQGHLIDMQNGFIEVPGLLTLLENSLAKNKKGQYLSGFLPGFEDNYPEFYLQYYNQQNRSFDSATANAWLREQSDFRMEHIGLPLLRTAKLEKENEEKILSNYSLLKNLYGSLLLAPRAGGILISQLEEHVGKQENESVFRSFLKEKKASFPEEDWKVLNMLVGNHYYGAIAKDTLGLLRFLNEEPVVYAHYFKAMVSNMIARKQLSAEAVELLCKWTDLILNEESSHDLLSLAVYLHKLNHNQKGSEEYQKMADDLLVRYKIEKKRTR